MEEFGNRRNVKIKSSRLREGLLSGVLWKGGSMGLLCEA